MGQKWKQDRLFSALKHNLICGKSNFDTVFKEIALSNMDVLLLEHGGWKTGLDLCSVKRLGWITCI